MDQPSALTSTLGIFRHHLYELSKGMRPLILMTVSIEAAGPIVSHLVAAGVAHHVHDARHSRVNIVFGRPAAVTAARRFMVGPLCDLSPEHDFMLGILLGYDREQQCLRYLARSEAGRGVAEAAEAEIAGAERAVMH